MRILHLYDTHNLHRQLINSPTADIIIHSGDISYAGTGDEVMDFVGILMGQTKGNMHQLFNLLSLNERTAHLEQFFLETFYAYAIIWRTMSVSLYKNNRYERVK